MNKNVLTGMMAYQNSEFLTIDKSIIIMISTLDSFEYQIRTCSIFNIHAELLTSTKYNDGSLI